MTDEFMSAYLAGREAGEMRERLRIVTWLQESIEPLDSKHDGALKDLMREVVSDIKAGEHEVDAEDNDE